MVTSSWKQSRAEDIPELPRAELERDALPARIVTQRQGGTGNTHMSLAGSQVPEARGRPPIPDGNYIGRSAVQPGINFF